MTGSLRNPPNETLWLLWKTHERRPDTFLLRQITYMLRTKPRASTMGHK